MSNRDRTAAVAAFNITNRALRKQGWALPHVALWLAGRAVAVALERSADGFEEALMELASGEGGEVTSAVPSIWPVVRDELFGKFRELGLFSSDGCDECPNTPDTCDDCPRALTPGEASEHLSALEERYELPDVIEYKGEEYAVVDALSWESDGAATHLVIEKISE